MSLKQAKRVNIPFILFPAVKIIMPFMEATTMWNQKMAYREADWRSHSNQLPQLQTCQLPSPASHHLLVMPCRKKGHLHYLEKNEFTNEYIDCSYRSLSLINTQLHAEERKTLFPYYSCGNWGKEKMKCQIQTRCRPECPYEHQSVHRLLWRCGRFDKSKRKNIQTLVMLQDIEFSR